jgi:hypothetical protein
MRTFVACFVLAAAVATPGIVVAATSSTGHWAPYEVSAPIATPIQTAPPAPRGPINPALRPAVDAVKAALAAEGVELTVQPLGGEAAVASALDPSKHCPTVITFMTDSEAHLGVGTCAGEASVTTDDGITIFYTPPSIGPTIRRALGLSG